MTKINIRHNQLFCTKCRNFPEEVILTTTLNGRVKATCATTTHIHMWDLEQFDDNIDYFINMSTPMTLKLQADGRYCAEPPNYWRENYPVNDVVVQVDNAYRQYVYTTYDESRMYRYPPTSGSGG